MSKERFHTYISRVRLLFIAIFVSSMAIPFVLDETESPLLYSNRINIMAIILVMILLFYVPSLLILLYRKLLFERSGLTWEIFYKSLLVAFPLSIALLFLEQIMEFIVVKILQHYIYYGFDFGLIFVVYVYHLSIVFLIALFKE